MYWVGAAYIRAINSRRLYRMTIPTPTGTNARNVRGAAGQLAFERTTREEEERTVAFAFPDGVYIHEQLVEIDWNVGPERIR